VRDREGDDQSGLDERLLALDEKLRELHEPPDGHEPGVSEKADERGSEHLAEDVPIDTPKHARW
jgi:hypothetical protein